jgi:2-polyprenyl-3-methyl-5-hydroxy-6-metoxy-1,4-benzoquinol methylase
MNAAPTPEERERSFRRVQSYYETYAEWDRLENPTDGWLEFHINRSWIQRYLPPSGARVLDLGGGPGRYSIWLAGLGYKVTLVDLSADQLEVARTKAKEAAVDLEAIVHANAVDLAAFGDESFDAVLCMGPMYHLLDEADRQAAAREVARVAKPGAPLFVAFINRLPIARSLIGEQLPTMPAEAKPFLDRWADTGVFIAPGRQLFTDSYYVHPDEVRPLMESVGIESLELIASESLMGGGEDRLPLMKERQPHLDGWVLDHLTEVAREPSVIGSSWHLLYIGRKP